MTVTPNAMVTTANTPTTIIRCASDAILIAITGLDLRMIYLDNAAQSWPKPQTLYLQAVRALMSAEQFDENILLAHAQGAIATLFNASPQCIRFTKSARSALEWGLLSLLRLGQHVIVSSVEHEAVMRPLRMLREQGLEITQVACAPDGSIDPEDLFQAVKPHTKAIVLAHASNVAGAVQPLGEISAYARTNNLLLIVDAAQTAGVFPIDMQALGVDVLVFTGHKGLFGPWGTGGIVASSTAVMNEIEKVDRPEVMLRNPRALLALVEGVEYILKCGVPIVRQHEVELTARLLKGLYQIPGVSVYGPPKAEKRIGIVCFNIQGMPPNEVARSLETEYDVICRAGTHSSPDAHRTLGTWPEGAVRLSIGWNNTLEEIDYTITAIHSVAAKILRKQSHISFSGKKRKTRVLIIPQIIGETIEHSEWQTLTDLANTTMFKIGEMPYLLSGKAWGADLNRCLEMARSYAGRFDFILGQSTGAFLWHVIFRLAGDRTPFALVPHFNHVYIPEAFAVLLSSQVALPTDIVFAGSQVVGDVLARFGFRCDSLYPLGIDLKQFRPFQVCKNAIRASLGLPYDKDILIYTGRVDPDKNVLELLDVFDNVAKRHSVLLVICYHYFNEDYLEQCKRYSAKLKDIRWVQSPNRETLNRYYNAADLFVSAAVSIFETFGRSPIEAMACGLPPVVPEYNGFRETIPTDCGVLVPTLKRGNKKYPDIFSMSQAISTLLSNRGLLEEKSQNAIRHAERFRQETAQRAMLEKFKLSKREKQLSSTLEIPSQISLERYPDFIRDLWEGIEEKVIVNLIAEFLLTGQPPLQPSWNVYQRFLEAWFVHY